MSWPPTLEQLKEDQKVPLDDTRDDERYQSNLDAAVAWIERVRPQFNYNADPLDTRPAPSDDHVLGTIRLAARWFTRPRSPDGLVSMNDLGTARVSSFDPDIDRMLRIGRYAKAVIG
ncbi:hypothetical protein ACFORH_43000 [Amycolatopsis roodepoortensis]|uniref:Head-to-tail adaptor n=1 Tax=Amycolatopsis roodepoortensis TaxID=700274 RepID=A0ABR9L2R9_9PSEU|nr:MULTISPECIES: hypothetical protein [Amycolatopsis]MBE1575059.1 hypothetical protein [Amycolatopsis roodepoortensis]GHG97596.1 hypothetical protein GCM10017788_77230 [Amycolatopsis acidiphila]